MENKPVGKVPPVTIQMKGQSIQTPRPQEVRNPAYAQNVVNPFVVPGIKKVNIDSQLNPSLSFDNFIEGRAINLLLQ